MQISLASLLLARLTLSKRASDMLLRPFLEAEILARRTGSLHASKSLSRTAGSFRRSLTLAEIGWRYPGSDSCFLRRLALIYALARAVANLACAAAVARCLNAGLLHALFICSLRRRRSAGFASILSLSVAPPLIAPSNLFSRVVGFRHDSIM